MMKIASTFIGFILALVATTSLAQQNQSAATPAALIAQYEKALAANPADDVAVEDLHRLLAGLTPIARAEKLRLKEVIRQHTRQANTVLVLPDEPGTPLIVSGVVRDIAGKPITGALLYVFHADAKGFYTPDRAMDEPNSRLFGYMKTSSDGRYEFRTIHPGGYPQPLANVPASSPMRFIPQHIHLLVTAAGYRDHKCQSTCQLVFADDPRMTPEWHQWAKDGGNPILHVTPGQDGVQRGVYDIVLQRN